ncbi:zinc metalloprotease [Bacillus sp. FJAT-27916]|uniref:RIP metalloprotease RseP n=1 Tax=Bacillaceae TaxID=186817 RepID=UPI0006707D1D|nr:RIP metalloprotease RseP [Bacillus sp. FJAT-27916]KMY44976.1 zinc metalloprotease [Bacillus sp. FJAT-27916]
MQTIIAFILIFGGLVFFHELGHLIFAKRAGILCREFAIGFGPKIFTITKNETVYTIRLLPLGGYVRMAGEDAEAIELKPGHRIGILCNEKDEVDKIIVTNKDKYPEARMIEVEEADLDHQLIIRGYEEGEEDSLKTFKVHPKAIIVEDGLELQIAPYDRQFSSKTVGQRALAIFAGPMMNFVLAAVIFMIIGMIQGVVVNDPVLGKLTEDGPAITSGLKEGDVVKSINGDEMGSWEEIQKTIQKNANNELDFIVERDGATEELTVTPKLVEDAAGKRGIIGVYAPTEKSFVKAVGHGFTETYLWTKQIFIILGDLVTGGFDIDQLSGPVGIYVSTEEVAKSGTIYLLKWAGVLSINLGIMNLLPLPALDGGRLLFIAIEAVRGKPIDKQKEGIVHFIGFALLMLLMIVVTWNDIQRFFF